MRMRGGNSTEWVIRPLSPTRVSEFWELLQPAKPARPTPRKTPVSSPHGISRRSAAVTLLVVRSFVVAPTFSNCQLPLSVVVRSSAHPLTHWLWNGVGVCTRARRRGVAAHTHCASLMSQFPLLALRCVVLCCVVLHVCVVGRMAKVEPTAPTRDDQAVGATGNVRHGTGVGGELK